MKSVLAQNEGQFAEYFVDINRNVPFYQKYGLALNVALSHTKPSNVCVTNLSRLWHVCSMLNSLTGSTRYFHPLMQSMAVKELKDLTNVYLQSLASSTTYEVTNKFVTRYEEIISMLSKTAIRGLQTRKEVNNIKRLFIKSLGTNNSALFFNQQHGAIRPFPKKFDAFKAAINTFISEPEIRLNEYQKAFGASNIIIPAFYTMSCNAVLLDLKALVMPNAEHTHTMLYCEDDKEYYIIIPTTSLLTMLALVVPLECNELDLASAKLRSSLNTVVSLAVETNCSDVTEAFKLAAKTKTFRRLI